MKKNSGTVDRTRRIIARALPVTSAAGFLPAYLLFKFSTNHEASPAT